MDFGGFILFGLGLLALFAGAVGVIGLVAVRSRWLKHALCGLAVGVLCLALFGMHLRQAYWLDEPLAIAAIDGDLEAARALLARGADANNASFEGATALEYARQNGNDEMVRLLQQSGARR